MTLRERLREGSPELLAAFERSWAIAHDEWLAALAPSQDSFNSYPHLRNLEVFLDRICAEYAALHEPSAAALLSPAEAYVMLSAILFHDIGRVLEKDEGHGAKSQEIIRDAYAGLGIPSRELAEVIGLVAACHTLPPPRCTEWLRSRLSTVAVSPYGEIRQRLCASLLRLIDHLDTACTRVLPEYVCAGEGSGAVGAFRRAIRGVAVDLRAQMVKVVLSDSLSVESPSLVQAPDDLARFTFQVTPHYQAKGQDERELVKNLRRNCKTAAEVRANAPDWPGAKLFGALGLTPDELIGLVARGLLQAYRGTGRADLKWPRELLVAIILANTRKNQEALDPIKSVLSAVGVPVSAWLIEYQEHLYDAEGGETYEPIFHREYLKNVALSMWRLSVGVFAQGRFSYETLAAEMRDPDVERVRRAVRRLSVVCTSQDTTSAASLCPFWVGQEQWKWIVRSRNDSAHCSYLSIDGIKRRIGDLQPPTGGKR